MAYLYLVKQIGLAGAFGAWAYIIAKGLFARSSLRLSLIEEVALLVPAGLAVASLLLFGLGLAGALTALGILSGAGLALALACWRLRGQIASGLSRTVQAATGLSGISAAIELARPAIASRESLTRLAMIAIVGTVLVPVALNGLTPPLHSDEVRYHLPYALHFVEQGRIVPNLDLRFPFFTLNVNLLYVAAIVFGDDVTPHYVHLLLGTLAGVALYVLAAPACGRLIACCAVLLFFVTPNFRVFASTAYIDLGLAAFITSTIACLDRARERPALVVCAGLVFGAALGSKYLALAFVPLLVAWAAYRTREVAQIARFTAIALLIGAPWYVYNFAWTGNPVSPFAGELFGAWPWTAEDLAGQTRQLTQQRYERSLSGLLSFPYYLVTDSWRFSISSVPELLALGLVALALLPLWNGNMRPYGFIVLVVLVAWFFSTPYFRYLTPILPVWCLISVWSVERVLWFGTSLVARRQSLSSGVRRHVSYAAAATVLFVAEYHFWLHNRWLDRDAVTERVVNRDHFLRERVPVYGVVEHLRRSGVRDEVIYAFPPGALLTYVRKNRIVGDYFGQMGYRRNLLTNALCPERFVERLQLKGVSRLVVSQKYLDSRLAWSNYITSRLTIEYVDRDATVFRIESESEPPSGLSRLPVGGDDPQVIPLVPVASGGFLRGSVRVVNRSDQPGIVMIHGIDDTGKRSAAMPLELGIREAQHFNSADLVACGIVGGMTGGTGDDEAGSWWLSLATDLDIETFSYIRAEDGFTTSMHEVATATRRADGTIMHHVPFFNSGNVRSQASHLRLINPGARDVGVTITGRDDAGEPGGEEVHLSLPAGTACRLGASALESGAPDGDGSGCDIISGGLGRGLGRWRLSVVTTGGDVQVMSLLANSTGHLTNLSASSGMKSGTHTLPLFMPVPDSDGEPRGLARIVNHSNMAGTVQIHGIDDTGTLHGPLTLVLDGQEAVHLGSGDLESGNASKGLPEGLGDGDGYWRLRLTTELNIEALAYARTRDGFVTSMTEVAKKVPVGDGEFVHYVPSFNPGRNTSQASWLRLTNTGRRDVEMAIEGRDRTGSEAPEGVVRLTLPAGQACMLSAQTLESGKRQSDSSTCAGEQFDFDGRLGRGAGKWSLFVTAEGGGVQVMSLLESPTGHLANLSVTNAMPPGRPTHGKRLDRLPDATIARLERWGPRSSNVGEQFNVQPNGNSALWFQFVKLDRHVDYRIHIGSQPILTTVAVDRNLITASLTQKFSRQIVSTAGRLPIHLVDPLEGKQLIGHFEILPR